MNSAYQLLAAAAAAGMTLAQYCHASVMYHTATSSSLFTNNALADYRRQIIGRLPIVYFRMHLRSIKVIL